MNMKLDVEIADKVMGWKSPIEVSRTKLQPLWRTAFKFGQGDSLGDYGRFYDQKGNKIFCGEPHQIHFPLHYSSAVSSSFLVVEKMRERGFEFKLEFDGEWSAWFPTKTRCPGIQQATGDDAAKAICLAALETLKATVDK